MKQVTKKQLVAEIRSKLKQFGIVKYGCVEIKMVPNVFWVSMNQILTQEHIKSVMYQLVRHRLYSKPVSRETLIAINNELRKQLLNI